MTESFQPGFQGSETTGVEVEIYPQGNDPVLQHTAQKLLFRGRVEKDRSNAITKVQTRKTMGKAAGTFTIELKPPEFGTLPKLRDILVDDDWVDITFTRHSKRFHVMRGLIDDVFRTVSVGGEGATVETYTIVGRDFGKIFEQTQIWFNYIIGEGLAAGLRVFQSVNISRPLNETVEGFLLGFLREIQATGRSIWRLPTSMPNGGGEGFLDVVKFLDTHFGTVAGSDPNRIAINSSLMDVNGAGLWRIAQEWSDPMFAELFTDIWSSAQGGRPPRPEEELTTTDTVMAIVLRDRPFPTSTDGLASNWFDLPLYIVPRQAIVSSNLGKTGRERFTVYQVSPQIVQELGVSHMELVRPLIEEDAAEIHGARNIQVATRYAPNIEVGDKKESDFLFMASDLRERFREWHALNPYFHSGSVQLGMGRPDIRIGGRLRIPSEGEEEEFTAYVEQVNQDWVFQRGLRTATNVTRGWYGTDETLIDELQKAAGRATEPRKAQPESAPQG